jgi:hypothetical protein
MYSICAKIDAQLFIRPLMENDIMKILVIAWNWFFVNYEICSSESIGCNEDIKIYKFIQESVFNSPVIKDTNIVYP